MQSGFSCSLNISKPANFTHPCNWCDLNYIVPTIFSQHEKMVFYKYNYSFNAKRAVNLVTLLLNLCMWNQSHTFLYILIHKIKHWGFIDHSMPCGFKCKMKNQEVKVSDLYTLSYFSWLVCFWIWGPLMQR